MADEPEYKKIEDVDSAEKMKSFVDNTNLFIEKQQETIVAQTKEIEEGKGERGRLAKDLDGVIQISKDRWKETDPVRNADYELGKWMGAVIKNDRKHLEATNTKILITSKSSPDQEKIIPVTVGMKTDLGTPLTGDASGTDAQYLIPQIIYETTILRTLMAVSEVIPKFTKVTMKNRLHRYPAESTAFALTFVTNEATSKTEQNPTWTYKDLEAETYAGWVGVTDELMEDTFADIGANLKIQAVEAYQDQVEEQLLNGSGSPVTGILQNASCLDYVMASTGFADISWADLDSMRQKLTKKKLRNGAVYVMHPTIWDYLINQQDAVGRFYWSPDVAPPRRAKGYPVLLADNMPDLDDTAVSTAFVLFGNLKYTLYGIRMGLEMKYFTETMYAVQDDENFFRIRTRFAGVVGIPANYTVLKTAAN